MNVFASTPASKSQGVAILGECYELIDERRIDAAALADLVRQYEPYAFAIVEQASAGPGEGVSSTFR